jgi:hypothetical protein
MASHLGLFLYRGSAARDFQSCVGVIATFLSVVWSAICSIGAAIAATLKKPRDHGGYSRVGRRIIASGLVRIGESQLHESGKRCDQRVLQRTRSSIAPFQ